METKKNITMGDLNIIDISNLSEKKIKELMESFKDLPKSSSNGPTLNGDMANEFNDIFAKENHE